MESKQKKNGAIDLPVTNDIQTIRDILMGDKMAEYRKSFNSIEKQMSKLESKVGSDLDGLEQRINDRFKELEKHMNQQVEKLEKLLMKNVNSLNKRIDEVSEQDREDLGALLSVMSQKLTKK